MLILVACISAFSLGNIVGTRKDFYNELWGPTYLLVHGKSPYDTSGLNPELPAVWLPMAIGIFAPLGWLSGNIATKTWFLISIIALFLIMVLALQDSKSPLSAILAGVFAYFFPPTINHFALGQFSLITALCMMLAAYYANKGHGWRAAFLVALGLTKPQLGLLAAIGLSFYYFQRSDWRGIILFGARVVCAALIMSLPLFIVGPGWMRDWFAATQRNPSWLQPSLFSTLVKFAGIWGYLLWGGVAFGGALICWHLWKRFAPEVAIAWTLGLTTIVSPYIWSWDFVLLLPIWTLIFMQANWKKRIFLSLAYLIGWMGMTIVQSSGTSNNQAFWWVPLWFLGAILIVVIWNSNSGRQTVS